MTNYALFLKLKHLLQKSRSAIPRKPLNGYGTHFVRTLAFKKRTSKGIESLIVSFFDQDGREKGSIFPHDSRFTLCACITRDDFGPLATNLTLLLEKAPDDAYPWATNILDLSTLSEAWAYFGWGSKELRAYLEERLTLHGKVLSE